MGYEQPGTPPDPEQPLHKVLARQRKMSNPKLKAAGIPHLMMPDDVSLARTNGQEPGGDADAKPLQSQTVPTPQNVTGVEESDNGPDIASADDVELWHGTMSGQEVGIAAVQVEDRGVAITLLACI